MSLESQAELVSQSKPLGQEYLTVAQKVAKILKLTGQYNRKVEEAALLIHGAKKGGILLEVDDVLGPMGISEELSLRVPRTNVERMRVFMRQAYPQESINDIPDEYILRIFQVLPAVVKETEQLNQQGPRKGRKLDPDTHLRRLGRWVSGDDYKEIAADEHLATRGLGAIRFSFAEILGREIGLDVLVQRAQALQEVLGSEGYDEWE